MPRFASIAPNVSNLPSVRYVGVDNAPKAIVSATTVVLVTRDGKPQARFDLKSSLASEQHSILLCVDGTVFHQLMIEHCVVGTPIEWFLPDGTTHKYSYRV